MRNAGLAIEVLIEYLALFEQGDDTIEARKELLIEQRVQLAARMEEMRQTLQRLDGKRRSANVITLEETELMMLRRQDFLELIEQYPQISIGLLKELAGRIRKSDSHISSLSLKDAMGRVSTALIHVAEKTGRKRGDAMIIPKIPVQQDLANMAGTARETISRVMAHFEQTGCIEKEGHRVIIKEFEKFKQRFC